MDKRNCDGQAYGSENKEPGLRAAKAEISQRPNGHRAESLGWKGERQSGCRDEQGISGSEILLAEAAAEKPQDNSPSGTRMMKCAAIISLFLSSYPEEIPLVSW